MQVVWEVLQVLSDHDRRADTRKAEIRHLPLAIRGLYQWRIKMTQVKSSVFSASFVESMINISTITLVRGQTNINVVSGKIF